MNDKEMIDKADKIVNDIASTVAMVSVGISLIRLGFEAGMKHRDKEVIEDVLDPEAMRQWAEQRN